MNKFLWHVVDTAQMANQLVAIAVDVVDDLFWAAKNRLLPSEIQKGRLK